MNEGSDSKPVTYGVFRDAVEDLEVLRDEIEEMIEEEADLELLLDDNDGSVNVEISNRLQNLLVAFASLAVATVEDRCSTLIIKELIKDEYVDQPLIDLLRSDDIMSQSRRERLLHEAGIVDGSLLSDMQCVRGLRNQVVHSIYGRFELREEAEEFMESALSVITRLDGIIESSAD